MANKYNVLLVGNGFDIGFNKKFGKDKILSHFINKDSIYLDKFFKFTKKNYKEISEYFQGGYNNESFIKGFKKALSASEKNDSIEKMFEDIQYEIKKNVIEKFYARNYKNIEVKKNLNFINLLKKKSRRMNLMNY